MEFRERLAALRKARGLTHIALSDAVGLTVLQVRRYEGGVSQPSIDVIRRLAIALGVSADALAFDQDDRGPDETLRYQFETVSRMTEQQRLIVRELLDALILKNQVEGVMTRVGVNGTAVRNSREEDR
ncbi:helix-turn-helix transcriptional regulator [Paraburkholderia strydomiana]|jgi:transcriptional regulator with XRE-family HTH domain|uniref:helix-turn-helix domain-containing protein n=1 Tax=Paraburkholderia strydomiana TaxID=1245417 RepID=UPI0038BA5C6A